MVFLVTSLNFLRNTRRNSVLFGILWLEY
uniref:Uncharacterized protein n=1 Tax=Arundo donax TaxID=35708 RepID=A0A0A9E9N6_ARUDO